MDNSAVVMAVSGARGSMLNLTQMAGCLGQQSVRGERIMRGYGTGRCPTSGAAIAAPRRTFITNSYKSGLSPTEFFFHAIGGREVLWTRRPDIAERLSPAEDDQCPAGHSRSPTTALSGLPEAGSSSSVTARTGADPAKSSYGAPVDVKGIVESVVEERSNEQRDGTEIDALDLALPDAGGPRKQVSRGREITSEQFKRIVEMVSNDARRAGSNPARR